MGLLFGIVRTFPRPNVKIAAGTVHKQKVNNTIESTPRTELVNST